ncbi:MAG TPA: DUF4307 domain-containing protein [Beutenbergiaceae bacterium]|nr:DUF4307 domain-containing protein [Beutenbergiaceae bacterium]
MDDALGGPEPTSQPDAEPKSGSQHHGASSPAAAALLAERYGKAPTPRQRRRLVWIIAAAVAVVGLAVGSWIVIDQLRPSVTAQEVGFVVHDETSIEIILDVTMPPGERAECTVEALDAQWGLVGLLEAEVGPMTEWVNRVHIDVATSARASSGVVQSCTLLD